MEYGPLSSPRPIAARPQNRMSVRMTLELLGAVPLDDRPCNDAAPHRCSESPGGQCHSGGHPPPEARPTRGLGSAPRARSGPIQMHPAPQQDQSHTSRAVGAEWEGARAGLHMGGEGFRGAGAVFR